MVKVVLTDYNAYLFQQIRKYYERIENRMVPWSDVLKIMFAKIAEIEPLRNENISLSGINSQLLKENLDLIKMNRELQKDQAVADAVGKERKEFLEFAKSTTLELTKSNKQNTKILFQPNMSQQTANVLPNHNSGLPPPPPSLQSIARPILKRTNINSGNSKKDYSEEIKMLNTGKPIKPSDIAEVNDFDRKIIKVDEETEIVDVEAFQKLRPKEFYPIKKSI